jgi:Flavodoxins
MSRVAVVFWSGTGNTAAMAEAVAEGARTAGADVSVLGPAEFTPEKAEGFDGIAFGCPAMGAEVLEEYEFEPMFSDVEGSLSGKRSHCSVHTDGVTDSGCVTGKTGASMPASD